MNLLSVSGISSVLVVVLTSLFKNVDWSSKAKVLVAAVLSILGGAVTVIQGAGSWNIFASNGVLAASGLVFGASQLIFKLVTEGTKLENTLANSLNVPRGQ